MPFVAAFRATHVDSRSDDGAAADIVVIFIVRIGWHASSNGEAGTFPAFRAVFLGRIFNFCLFCVFHGEWHVLIR